MPSQNFDVTAANAEVILSIDEIAPAGVPLQMFSVDSVLSSDAIDFTETRKGVDGKMVAGVIKNVYPVTINLEASSPSVHTMELLRDAMNANNRVYLCQLTVYLPAIGKLVTFKNGVLKNGPVIQSIGKTIQPTAWRFEFEGVE